MTIAEKRKKYDLRIVTLNGQGKSVRKIADELELSRSYVQRALSRMIVKSRGWIQMDTENKVWHEHKMEIMGNSEKKSAGANVYVNVAAGGYPRVMSCSNDLEHWVEREVLCKKGEGYLAQHVDGFEDGRLVLSFRYAKEVEPESKIMELTIDEIAERFGVSADQIVIKK